MAETHDLFALFSSDHRDFLVRSNGHQVEIGSLYGKVVGIYFSGQWCDNCRRFNPELVEIYQEFAPLGDLEIVFVSYDRDEESFNEYFSEMPWLAIPFFDDGTRTQLKDLFDHKGIPYLVFLDPDGKVSTENGAEFLMAHSANGYPFTGERITFLIEEAKRNQTLSSLLVSRSRDYLLSKDRNQVPIAELEGRTVALYFAMSRYDLCKELTSTLVDVYNALKECYEAFEVVLVPLDNNEEEFKLGIETMPWFTLPYKDVTCQTLAWYFDIKDIPTLLIVGPDGKTVNTNAAELVKEHGADAFPFTKERIKEVAEIKRAEEESQTLESLLVLGNEDFVLGKDGSKVPVSELVGKNILLYFSAHWCASCIEFTPKLVEVYSQIKAKDDAFEVIFVSSDGDESSYEEHFSEMPWLALPYGDERVESLCQRFNIDGIPTAVAIGPSGRTVAKEAQDQIDSYGAKAYPFTQENLERLEEQEDQMTKRWPQKLRHELHAEHDLFLGRRVDYFCDECEKSGSRWSFYCEKCDFDLHPKCAMKKNKEKAKDVPELELETMINELETSRDELETTRDEPQCSYAVC